MKALGADLPRFFLHNRPAMALDPDIWDEARPPCGRGKSEGHRDVARHLSEYAPPETRRRKSFASESEAIGEVEVASHHQTESRSGRGRLTERRAISSTSPRGMRRQASSSADSTVPSTPSSKLMERRMNSEIEAIESSGGNASTEDPANAGTRNSADHERETRAFGALVKTINSVRQMQAELDNPLPTPHRFHRRQRHPVRRPTARPRRRLRSATAATLRSVLQNCPASVLRPPRSALDTSTPTACAISRTTGWSGPATTSCRLSLPPPVRPGRRGLVLGGRGAGKTRTGAEWVRARALGLEGWGPRVHRIALVGERWPGPQRHAGRRVRPPRRPRGRRGAHLHCIEERTPLPNGTLAQMFAADDPDSLRGPQFDAAWCDELAKWPRPERAWDTLQLALRLDSIRKSSSPPRHVAMHSSSASRTIP